MKQIFTLLFISFTLAASAQDQERRRQENYSNAVINVSSLADQSFIVYLDGREFRAGWKDEVSIDHVSPGMHSLKIVQQKSKNRNIFRSGFNEITLYNSKIFVRDQTQTDFVISRKGKVVKDETVIRYNDNHHWNQEGNGNGFYSVMNQRDFERLKQSISNAHFDSDKMMIAKQVINSNYFGVSQVKEMMRLFNFDSNKLDIAKLAYGKTVDRNNYFSVYDEFSFSSSKQELNRYISNYRS